MEIEFDPVKDLANLAKHGVSLAAAAEMNFDDAIVSRDDRKDYGETRWRAFGRIGNRLHVLGFTTRGNIVRPISLRAANSREQRQFDER